MATVASPQPDRTVKIPIQARPVMSMSPQAATAVSSKPLALTIMARYLLSIWPSVAGIGVRWPDYLYWRPSMRYQYC